MSYHYQHIFSTRVLILGVFAEIMNSFVFNQRLSADTSLYTQERQLFQMSKV